jgi:uncharacterized SAM-binding protein YcdF (DUF218 family)
MTGAIAKCGRGLAYSTLLVAALAAVALFTAGIWLPIAPEEPRKADAIMVLAGGFERSMYAADLYKKGLAPKVWISRPARERSALQLEQLGVELPGELDIHRQILLRKGVAPGDIEAVGSGSVSTAEEARALRDKLGGSTPRMIVVTSPAHARRARMIFSDTLAGQGGNLQVLVTPYEQFDASWWRDQASARAVVLELAKLAYYICGGRFFSSAATP